MSLTNVERFKRVGFVSITIAIVDADTHLLADATGIAVLTVFTPAQYVKEAKDDGTFASSINTHILPKRVGSLSIDCFNSFQHVDAVLHVLRGKAAT